MQYSVALLQLPWKLKPGAPFQTSVYLKFPKHPPYPEASQARHFLSMKIFQITAALAAFINVAGCSIHPLPQDVTGFDTYAIVAQIRCEVRQALKFRVDKAVRSRPDDAHLADELEHGRLKYGDLRKTVKDPDLKGVLNQYAAATIAYNFSLDMTESNNLSGNATLTRPFKRGADTIGLVIGSDHKRENTRTFTIDDTFEKLLADVPESYCAGTTNTPNYDYPIAGRTRLADTVVTFLDLNQSGNLGQKVGGPKTPSLTDDLQFTTTYTSSVAPGFTFASVGSNFVLSALGGKFEGIRSDIHRVTVALAMPERGKKPLPLTIAESRQVALDALAHAADNRFQIYIQKISNDLTTPSTSTLLSQILP